MTHRNRMESSWRSQSGAFDLPSIMVGVAVVAILTGGVLAAIFGVIPWAQNNQAQQSLGAVTTAEGVHYARSEGAAQGYASLGGLQTAGYIASDVTSDIAQAVGDRDQWAAATLSATGNTYCASDAEPQPAEHTGISLEAALNECIGVTNAAVTAAAAPAAPEGLLAVVTDNGTGLPDPSAAPGPGPAPAPAPGGGTPTYLTPVATAAEGLIVNQAGDVYAWGENANGSIGTGSTDPVTTPTLLTGALAGKDIAGVEAGYSAVTYFWDTAGALYSTGTWNTEMGVLGQGDDTTTYPTPTLVAGGDTAGKTIVAADGAYERGYFVDADGELYGVGDALYTGWGGTEYHVPTAMPGPGNLVDVMVDDYNAIALDTDGGVWTWGWGSNAMSAGALSATTSVPTKIGGLEPVVDLDIGDETVIALGQSGTVYTWGRNRSGQIGNGIDDYNNTVSTPFTVPGLGGETVIDVEIGAHAAFARTADGDVYGWGDYLLNKGGAWPSGGADSLTPVRINDTVLANLGGAEVAHIDHYLDYAVVTTTDDRVFAWGDNWSGVVLGQAVNTKVTTAVQIALP